ncbi:hypothetical protein Pmani_006329 [Petrolisthes manimaculis]|uniref:Uncharacterized protein n=1 Tax=Petrolisthes manimaculis TaxID=1843537 RepID=A0AAE1QAU8_9EUCA|nr:hypothetical protein Pmani_006329 [Petrolisthes manimaculis]
MNAFHIAHANPYYSNHHKSLSYEPTPHPTTVNNTVHFNTAINTENTTINGGTIATVPNIIINQASQNTLYHNQRT